MAPATYEPIMHQFGRFVPRGQMIAGRKPIAFLAVALAIREHEVVAQVHGIPSPRDEVIDVGGRWRKRCVTVEAPAPLDIERPEGLKLVPLMVIRLFVVLTVVQ